MLTSVIVSFKISLLIGLTFSIVSSDDVPNVYQIALDEANQYTLNWMLDYGKSLVTFEVHYPVTLYNEWFAFGFSDYGSHTNADYCVLWIDWKRRIHFEDVWVSDNGTILIDPTQNCESFHAIPRKNVIKFAFTRKFDTCDERDYVIEDGTTHVVWLTSNGPLFKLAGLNINNQRIRKGMVRTQLLKNENVVEAGESDQFALEVLADAVRVPADDTTYWCHVQKLPRNFVEKHHIVQFEAIIQKGNEGLVHHMEVFHCETNANDHIPEYIGPCFAATRPNSTQVCKKVIGAWAMGATPFVLPPEAGYAIGGADYNLYVMLEVHYNNPAKKSDWIDSSGLKFIVTKNLRKYDAGIMELGLEYTDKMAIPPGQEEFTLSGFCTTECTAVGIPPSGIFVFGSQLHTHLTGVRVFTRHIRDGRELAEMNRDNHYSTHFQEIRRLKRDVHVLPGDALITTCGYRTTEKTEATLGGFAITDEMCVNYIHYYPAINLEVCKSSISDESLTTYFRFLKEWEHQKTSTALGITDNYKAIDWTPLRSHVVWELYHEAPLAMQCNMSSGDRFPGYWDNLPVTQVALPVAPPARYCD